jgi:hypothetical protein
VVMRDSKSYCAILLDDNNRKTIARLHFNRSKKYVGFFSSKREERVPIAALEDIYEHAERLQATVREYDDIREPQADRPGNRDADQHWDEQRSGSTMGIGGAGTAELVVEI